MSEEQVLPTGWAGTPLEFVLPIQYGKGLVEASRDKTGEVPVYGSSGIVGVHNQALTSKAALVIGRKGSIGSVYYSPVPCWPIDTVYFVEETPNTNLKFFLHLLTFLRLGQLDKSTAVPGLSRDDYNAVLIKVPPFAEQQRIVAAIEQQFTRLDAGVAALKSAQTRLKRYRAAVLKAAVEGKLTEAWRAEHPDTEPASNLLQRILAERHARWEADLRAKGKDPAKVRYEEPAGPDTTDLPALPEGWGWARFEQVSERVTVGHVGSMKDEYIEDGIPFLRGQNVRPNRFDPEGLKFVSRAFHQQLSKSALEPGDLLVVRSGSVGTACVMPDTYPEANCSDLVIVKRPIHVNPQYAAYYMNSTAQNRVRTQQVGIALIHFNTQSMAAMPLPLPPLAEQEQIVDEVERRLSVVTELEAIVETNLKRAERLRQSILREAFAGRLVPQDPNDEPASALLERIRQERVGNGRATKQEKERVPVLIPDRVETVEAEQGSLWDD
ncbi:MAG TPA: restriction endonuclease subunit S [Ktedonobacterales bacterium]|nr:restriction endonuclease subunit S [Ktedonobacterales bacterium]